MKEEFDEKLIGDGLVVADGKAIVAGYVVAMREVGVRDRQFPNVADLIAQGCSRFGVPDDVQTREIILDWVIHLT